MAHAHFACRVGTLPTPGQSRITCVEKVSTQHVENARHVNSKAKVKPAESCPPEKRRD